MKSQKYATIQFTKDDLESIKRLQLWLETDLGIRLSLPQTVMYGVDKIKKMEAIKRKLAQYEAMEAATQQSSRTISSYSVPNINNSVVSGYSNPNGIKRSGSYFIPGSSINS